jgi:hypothetical protein
VSSSGLFLRDVAFALRSRDSDRILSYHLSLTIFSSARPCRWSTFDPLYSSQFRAMSPLPNQPLVTNSPSTHLHYLTGRRNLLSLHTVLNLLPRHNAVQYIQDLVWGVVDPVNELGDELVLDYTLGENGKGQLGEGVGVWGVVRKSGVLTKIRKERWDVVSTSFQVLLR